MVPFFREDSRACIDRVIDAFFAACSNVGCDERLRAVPISSGFDPSVRFIGSHISVMLPLILENRIPHSGIAMWQDCLRTQNLLKLLEKGEGHFWGSHFIALGALFPGSCFASPAMISTSLFCDWLGSDRSDIEVSYFVDDTLIGELAEAHFIGCSLRRDPIAAPYRHKVGVKYVKGKNCNIALRGRGGQFQLVGNIILYTIDGSECGVELALGPSTILAAMQKLNHILDTFPLCGLDSYPAISLNQRVAEDAAVASLCLLREGLRPYGDLNTCRLLKKYIDIFQSTTFGLEEEAMAPLLLRYYQRQYTSRYVTPRKISAPPPSKLINELIGRRT